MIQPATVLAYAILSFQVLGSAAPQIPTRDRAPIPRTGTAVIKGRVVDGVTGAAIARARVTLQAPGLAAPVVTDADGWFSFTGLPAGPVSLMVQKSTFLMARYPAAGRTFRSNTRLTLRNGQALDDIVVPLFHGASISGRVFDANGDPIDYAQVSLMRLPRGGAGKPAMRESTSTNDLGEFRLGRLEAGTYLVQVTPRRMEEMPFPSNVPLPPQAPPAATPLPTFYPGALAMEQAQPIVLERAQSVSGIDVVLADGIPGVVSGVVTMSDGQPLPANTYPNVAIRRRVSEGIGGFEFSSGTMTRPDGSFRATLPPGEYTIEARVMPRTGATSRPEDELGGTARVTVVSGSEESVTIVAGPGASATGRVIFEGTTPAPPSPGRIRIPMYSETGMCRSGEATVGADWSFRVEGLMGTCSSQPMDIYGRWMLKAILVNGDNIMDAPFTFQTGQQLRNVQVIVSDRRSSMTFQVADEHGQATRDYVVIVYPVDKERWPQAVRPYLPPPIANPDGTGPASGLPGMTPSARPQTLSGLRPGDYYVVAIDDMEPDDVRDPSVLDRLRSGALRVTLSEGAALDVSLRRLNFAAFMRQK